MKLSKIYFLGQVLLLYFVLLAAQSERDCGDCQANSRDGTELST